MTGILALPVDLFNQISQHLSPTSLRSLAATSRPLRRIIFGRRPDKLLQGVHPDLVAFWKLEDDSQVAEDDELNGADVLTPETVSPTETADDEKARKKREKRQRLINANLDFLKGELERLIKKHKKQMVVALKIWAQLQKRYALRHHKRYSQDPSLPPFANLFERRAFYTRSMDRSLIGSCTVTTKTGALTVSYVGILNLRWILRDTGTFAAFKSILSVADTALANWSLSYEIFKSGACDMKQVKTGGVYILESLPVTAESSKHLPKHIKEQVELLCGGRIGDKHVLHYVGATVAMATRRSSHSTTPINWKVEYLELFQNRKNWPSYVVWANGLGEDDFSPSTYAMESLLNDYTDATKAGVGLNCRTFDLLSYFCIALVSDLERLWRKVKTLTDADLALRIQNPSGTGISPANHPLWRLVDPAPYSYPSLYSFLRGGLRLATAQKLMEEEPIRLSAFANVPKAYRTEQQQREADEAEDERERFVRPIPRPLKKKKINYTTPDKQAANDAKAKKKESEQEGLTGQLAKMLAAAAAAKNSGARSGKAARRGEGSKK